MSLSDAQQGIINNADAALDSAKTDLQMLLDELNEDFANLEEEEQESQKGTELNNQISQLEEAIDYIDNAKESISEQAP
jgi:flagellar biosynthesis chaperone FliJ